MSRSSTRPSNNNSAIRTEGDRFVDSLVSGRSWDGTDGGDDIEDLQGGRRSAAATLASASSSAARGAGAAEAAGNNSSGSSGSNGNGSMHDPYGPGSSLNAHGQFSHQQKQPNIGEAFANFGRALNVCGKLAPALIKWQLSRKELRDPASLREAIVRAGPVCIKAAQWAVDRGGLLPPDVVRALQPLQDRNESHSTEHTVRTLTREFGREAFEWVQPDPFACGSVGQLHFARLRGGRDVVVKVLHPGIHEGMRKDLEALLLILRMVPTCRNFDLDEVRRCILAQTDLRLEARNLEQFRRNFEGHEDRFRFPEPLMAGREALVETRADGVPFDDFIAARPHLAKRAVAARIAAYIKMGWVDNFLHGDMHRGNILYAEDDAGDLVITMVDAGMITVVRNGEALRRFVEGIFFINPERLANLMIDLNANPHADTDGFRRRLQNLSNELEYEPSATVRYRDILRQIPLAAGPLAEWDKHVGKPQPGHADENMVIKVSSQNMVRIIRACMDGIRSHQMMVPGDIVMMAMTFVVADGQSEEVVDPHDNIFHDALIFARETGLINLQNWLGYDPVPLLLFDKARQTALVDSGRGADGSLLEAAEFSDDEDDDLRPQPKRASSSSPPRRSVSVPAAAAVVPAAKRASPPPANKSTLSHDPSEAIRKASERLHSLDLNLAKPLATTSAPTYSGVDDVD